MASAGESPIGETIRPSYVALKNNLLYDAAATPNLQMEFRLAEHWTLQAGVGFNPFPLDDKVLPKWRHVSVELAPRYWLCKTFTRDFVSVNAAYAHYNVAGGMYPIGWMYKAVLDNRFQGDAVLFGASYGWQFAISPHFSIELEGGLDAGVTWYEQFTCKHCGEKLAQDRKWFVLPRLGVNLVVLLDGHDEEFADRCDCHRLHTSEQPEEQVPDTTSIQEEPVSVTPAEPVQQADTTATEQTPASAPSREQLREQIVRMEQDYDRQPSDSLREAIDELLDMLDELAHQDQMARLREAVLRPIEEFAPYNPAAPVTAEPNSVYMHFDVSRTEVDRSFIHNDELLDSIISVIAEAVKNDTIEIRLIKIIGMASFDGSRRYNERLGATRAAALHDYLQERFGFDESMFRIYNGGECWAELRWYLENEEFPGKHDVMTIIDQVPDYELRERFIKQHDNGHTYKYMLTHFKRYLRNLGSITVYYEVKDETDIPKDNKQ